MLILYRKRTTFEVGAQRLSSIFGGDIGAAGAHWRPLKALDQRA